MSTDLLSLDRKLALAARALDGWRAEIAVDGRRDDDDPLVGFAELTSRSLIDSIEKSGLDLVSAVPPLLLSTGLHETTKPAPFADPLAELRGPLASWCTHLHLARVIREATAVRAAAMRDEREADSYGREASLRAMLRSLCRPKQAGGVPEGKAAVAITDLAPGLLDGIVDEEIRRRELGDPIGPLARCCVHTDPEVVAAAQAYLRDTADEAREQWGHGAKSAGRPLVNASWVDAFAVRRAADVSEGWPAALSGRWLAELARGTELLAGLKVDVKVDAGRSTPRASHSGLYLVPPTGAWTFAHALHALGGALHLHGRDDKRPFAPHSPPHDLRRYVMGEAFMALASTEAFHARARGVSKAKAQHAARRLALTRLLERRQLALRVVLAPELARGRRAFVEAFAGLAEDALLGEAPRELASLLGAPGPLGPAEDAARFRAIGPGEALFQSLTERFDSDWWRNPKAAAAIRDRCAVG